MGGMVTTLRDETAWGFAWTKEQFYACAAEVERSVSCWLNDFHLSFPPEQTVSSHILKTCNND